MTATARDIAQLPPDARRAVLDGLSEAELASLEYNVVLLGAARPVAA